jgi:Transposase, Mutator family
VKCNVPVAEAINDEAVLPGRVQEALGSWSGLRGRDCWRCRSRLGSACCASCSSWRSARSWARRVSTTLSAAPCVTATRTGVTLGGRRVQLERPRVRTADGESEVSLQTYEHFADRDGLGRLALEPMLAGVSTRRYRRCQEPVGKQTAARERSTSKSSISRAFVKRTREALWHLMSRQLADLRPAVVMLDGIEIKGRTSACTKRGKRPTTPARSSSSAASRSSSSTSTPAPPHHSEKGSKTP